MVPYGNSVQTPPLDSFGIYFWLPNELQPPIPQGSFGVVHLVRWDSVGAVVA